VTCTSCDTENVGGAKFCSECGAVLARACPACAAPTTAGARFCSDCGAALTASPSAQPKLVAATPPQAERRLVSVLFADLVGFTAASEGRDSEDTRELLTRYFETARTVIERYGGIVEKFIGDAVMAIWGAPVANEDDAERAVRAGLELVAAVTALDPALRARAGVLTGEAAITLGAEGQGMVAGDLVNTASRIQSAAAPGTVLVGEATRRATDAAIVYEEGVEHDLKGKAESVTLWRAARVVAARRGEGRADGLEAPFVGREREFRLVKDLFHSTADDRRASLVSVIGVAGIGKSRLAWEFEKYVDGLVDNVYWHRGRCLSYGDGIAYWALAEMVRMRAGITEDEDESSAIGKLRDTVAEHVTDAEEREWVEPRLQHLLGLVERLAPDREDLFSAWRLFFERIAAQGPVVLVFEDLHWADAGLLDFVEYLLDWSRNHPIYVVALARPELADRQPPFGSRVRSATSLVLEPLGDDAMDELLRGLVPGLPEDTLAAIRSRADGVPLYAVETVRMLLGRGLLERDGDGYRVVGSLDALDVPETLHALIAARLDGLEPRERHALERAAVLGQTFSPRGLAAISGLPDEEVEAVLSSLVRKEMLYLDSDPRSPERGQYGFLQALVQRVAYETLARQERRECHLASARYLTERAGIDPEEIAEVIAAHYLDAYQAEPAAADAAETKASARDWLRRAGERAAALAATEDAQRAFEAAVALADDPLDRARLLERAGDLAARGNRLTEAREHFRVALELCESAGSTHDAARVAAALGAAAWRQGEIEEGIELMERAFSVLAGDEQDADMAVLAAQLGRVHYFADNPERATERIEAALDIAEALDLPQPLASALNTKSLLLRRRPRESHALLAESLRIALEHDLTNEALRAYNNLGVLFDAADRPEDVRVVHEEALALARRCGARAWETVLAESTAGLLAEAGEWEEALQLAASIESDPDVVDATSGSTWCFMARICIERGDDEAARAWLDRIPHLETADKQVASILIWKQTLVDELDGRLDDALAAWEVQMARTVEGGTAWAIAEVLRASTSLALAVGSPRRVLTVASFLDEYPASRRTRSILSQLHRAQGVGAAAAGDEDAAADSFGKALSAGRNLGLIYWLGPVLYDYGAWLVETARPDEAQPLLSEARQLFEQMGAVVWLERLDVIQATSSTSAPTSR